MAAAFWQTRLTWSAWHGATVSSEAETASLCVTHLYLKVSGSLSGSSSHVDSQNIVWWPASTQTKDAGVQRHIGEEMVGQDQSGERKLSAAKKPKKVTSYIITWLMMAQQALAFLLIHSLLTLAVAFLASTYLHPGQLVPSTVCVLDPLCQFWHLCYILTLHLKTILRRSTTKRSSDLFFSGSWYLCV